MTTFINIVRNRILNITTLLMMTLPLSSCAQTPEKQQENVVNPKNEASQKTMKIGVIGAGSLGGTVGKLLVKAGYNVMFSSRHPEELKEMAKELGSLASVGTSKQAAAFGDVLLFAVPYDAIPQLGQDLKDEIKGKIVLDACNGGSGDLGEEVKAKGNGPTSAKYLANTRLVRVFSSEDATAVDASFDRNGENKLAIPLAGDDQEAREIAAQLVRDVHCDPVIVGDLSTGVKFQRATPAFRANTNAVELRRLLGSK